MPYDIVLLFILIILFSQLVGIDGFYEIKAVLLIFTILYTSFFTFFGRDYLGIAIVDNLDKYEELGHSVNKIYNHPDSNSDYTYHNGTGFFINNQDIITNHHVIDDCESPKVKIEDTYYDAQPIAATEKWGIFNAFYITHLAPDYGLDIAVLRTKANIDNYFFIEEKSTFEKQDIYLPDFIENKAGYFSMIEGTVSQIDNSQIFGDINMRVGNSGSPLLNSYGHVMGVNHSIEMRDIKTSYSVTTSSKYLIKFLEEQNIPFTKTSANTSPREYLPIVSVICGA